MLTCNAEATPRWLTSAHSGITDAEQTNCSQVECTTAGDGGAAEPWQQQETVWLQMPDMSGRKWQLLTNVNVLAQPGHFVDQPITSSPHPNVAVTQRFVAGDAVDGSSQ